MFKLKSAALALSAVAFGMSLSTLASADPSAPSMVVRYNPSDLDSNSGVHLVYSRLLIAAEKVCPRDEGTHLMNEAVVECRRKAMAGAVAQIHNSRLAALSTRYIQTG
jgi:UrcA family protein